MPTTPNRIDPYDRARFDVEVIELAA